MIAPCKRWGPRETPLFIRNQETRRFYVGRWYPEKQRVAFANRYRRKTKYLPQRVPRYLRENTHCCDNVPFSRYWLNTSNPLRGLSRTHVMANWRKKFVRVFMPSLISDLVTIQPMTGPTGKIFTVKPVYSNTEEWQSG